MEAGQARFLSTSAPGLPLDPELLRRLGFERFAYDPEEARAYHGRWSESGNAGDGQAMKAMVDSGLNPVSFGEFPQDVAKSKGMTPVTRLPDVTVAGAIKGAVDQVASHPGMAEFAQFVRGNVNVTVADFGPENRSCPMLTLHHELPNGDRRIFLVVNAGLDTNQFATEALRKQYSGTYSGQLAQDVYARTHDAGAAMAEEWRATALHEIGHVYDDYTGGGLRDAMVSIGSRQKTSFDRLMTDLEVHVSPYAVSGGAAEAGAEVFSMVMDANPTYTHRLGLSETLRPVVDWIGGAPRRAVHAADASWDSPEAKVWIAKQPDDWIISKGASFAYDPEEPRDERGRWTDGGDGGRAAAFEGLADAQRGAPEAAMLRAQDAMGKEPYYPSANAWTYAMEHVGDLTHRMSEKYSDERNHWGLEYVASKVRNGLRLADNPVDSRNIAAIPDKRAVSGIAYAKAHAALTVYNDAQWHAREAAVALGERNLVGASQHLHALQDMIDSGTWDQVAGSYDPNYTKPGGKH